MQSDNYGYLKKNAFVLNISMHRTHLLMLLVFSPVPYVLFLYHMKALCAIVAVSLLSQTVHIMFFHKYVSLFQSCQGRLVNAC